MSTPHAGPEVIPGLRDPGLLHGEAYLAGNWIADADDGTRFEVTDPADGRVMASLPRLGAPETRRAIDAAAAAMPAWQRLTARERARLLRRLADAMLDAQEDLARIVTAEQGKPMAESRTEVAYAASFFEWFGEEGRRAYGDVIPSHAPDVRIVTLAQPIGVGAGITPWNFPLAMPARKLAPALAAGCPMVLKPAEQTPLSALAVAELASRVGIPAGVLNVVTTDGRGAPAVGGEMTGHRAVRRIGFTGSTAVGKVLMAQAAGTVKSVGLELGGNAPLLVLDDADLDLAVVEAIVCKFRNAGQTCISANRILVQDSVYDEFVERFTAAAAALMVGPGTDERSQLGPLIDDAAVIKVEQHIADALANGARLQLGGGRHANGGTYFQPTVLSDVSADSIICHEETFGPVAALQRFGTDQEAIALANDTPFGLAAYIFGRDLARVTRIAERIEAGIVGINTGLVSTEVAPFGGVKESGIGREGSHEGLTDWLETKYLCVGGLR